MRLPLGTPSSLIDEIAIVGISCRFPNADDPVSYWRLLESGTEAIATLEDRDLLAAGEDPRMLDHPDYVRAHGVLPGADLFDAQFFGVSPSEAALMDPQHRLFLECAWSAFEHAGYDPKDCPGPVGVYAGSGWNSYFLRNVAAHPEFLEPGSLQRTLLGNENDTLATRVSYKLGLHGPSMTVQSACSTSLVAVAQACQSLLSHESDMALAGGVSIRTPQAGYLHQEGSIFSRSGKCRAFDAGADGTVIGSGAGVVLLKRLDDAVADGDHIHGVIKAWAINNDGSVKAGYAAPSVEGQSAVIREAHALAGVHPETITYVETHGTGTVVGDPIEIAALTDVFRSGTDRTGFCAIGSVKTNVGHLDAAAGVAGLIKTVLALRNKKIPASLNFERPNPAIDFSASPFYVNTKTTEWETTGGPRRAGVSSFGIGGTNAHVVLEEAPPVRPADQGGAQLFPLSARTPTALEQRAEQLREHLETEPSEGLADIASTLQRGRRAFTRRQVVAGGTAAEVIEALGLLSEAEPAPAFLEGRQAAFMFSGQGPQHVGMARRLHATDPVFRAEADRCFDLLRSRHGLDLRELIHPDDASRTDEYDAILTRTRNAQPALFVLQYSLAKTLEHYGVRMAAGVGHSFGEYAAAAVAGVFTLEDALSLVVARGQVLEDLPAGSMMAVPLSPGEVEPLLGADLSIAAVNHPASCVVAGPRDAVIALHKNLAARDVDASMLRISYASHTAMVEPALGPFAEHFAGVKLSPPRVPFLSSVTGTWITDEQATDPTYWVTHLRERVRFADGLERVFRDTDHVLVELGPNEVLTSLAKRHPAGDRSRIASATLPRRSADKPDDVVFLRSLGSLWCAGVEVDWEKLHHGAQRRRAPLPTYPFERQRHWITPPHSRVRGEEPFDAAVRESRREATTRIDADDLTRRQAKVDLLERLSSAFMANALQALGDAPLDQVLPAYRPLVSEWLDRPLTACGPDELDELLVRTRQMWSGSPEVELVHRCGTALVDVLRGAADPVDLFTPLLDRAFAEPGEIFGTEYAPVIRRAVSGVLATDRAATGLRVLEIGGGTGITTGQVLRELADDGRDHRYVFTDISDAFVAHAGRRYAEHSWFSTARLDIEKSPAEQGIESGTFDLVVAANVLHATSDLRRTLDHARSLLAPGGLLLLAEITTPSLDFAMTYGLLMGAVSDDDRTRSEPFLSRERWEHTLRTEFTSVAAVPEDDALGHHVFVARNAGEQLRQDRGLRKQDDVGKWFRVPSWKRTATVRGNTERSGTWLVLGGSSAADTEFRRLLREHGHHVVTVRQGQEYRRQDASQFEIRPHEAEDHQRVLSELTAEGTAPTRIVHLWGLATADDDTSMRHWRGLVALTKAVDHAGLTHAVDLTVVTDGLHDVVGEHTQVGRSLLLGTSRVIPLEFPGITSRSVDFAVTAQPRVVAHQLVDEILAAHHDEVVAYRGTHRWVETVEPLTLDKADDRQMLRPGGVYLVTGGLGSIGSGLARHLVEEVGAKAVLVGRSGRGRDTEVPWYDGNPDVLVLTADVTDAARMREVVRTAETRFGPINGVIHSAGLLGDGAIVHKTVEDFEKVLAPKVTGTLVLHELFQDKDLDFLVLFSSLSARKPGFGQAAYAAANCFLDSFAHSAPAAGHRFVTSVNWDVWQGSGMAYDASGPKALQHLKLADFAQRGILPAQGVDAFRRVLASGLPQVYVTSSDYLDVLDDRRQDLSQVYLEAIEREHTQQQARPELNNEYVQPRTTTEQMLAEIWQALLGIERIGVFDDFFRLGGDSLLGSQFITRVRSAFEVHLSSRTLYDHPTIEGMAKAVDDALISNADPEAISEAIRQAKGAG
ncbi:SDR family NAD(P)-dependent oxidoreductase [Streptomyces sp. NPDC000070]|uniref:type I polyketide synthase n=1 Tax=Streptomyces sp. NPDC000070 TaxID=3154240 RepID=UPI0033313FAE